MKKDSIMLFWVLIAAIIYSYSFVTFSIPAKLYPAGFAGIARLVCDLVEDYLDYKLNFGLIYGVLNIIPAIVTFKYIGKRFALFSCINILLVSIFTTIFKPLIDVDDPLLMAVFGGLMCGLAVGILLAHNASSGGTDFIAIYASNRFKKPVWNYILALNVIILCLAGLYYGWERALYSIILQFCANQVYQRMHKRYRKETLMIVTKYPKEVTDGIMGNVRHGVTEIKAVGAYKQQEQNVLFTIVNSFQTNDVIKAILKADPNAFINVQETKRVIGNYYQKPLD